MALVYQYLFNDNGNNALGTGGNAISASNVTYRAFNKSSGDCFTFNGKAAVFNGNARFQFPNGIMTGYNADSSIECWVRSLGDLGFGFFSTRLNSGNWYFGFNGFFNLGGVYGGGIIVSKEMPNSCGCLEYQMAPGYTGTGLSNNDPTWHHVCANFRLGNDMTTWLNYGKVYIDGELACVGLIRGWWYTTGTNDGYAGLISRQSQFPIYMGYTVDSSHYCQCELANFRWYNELLSQTTIQQHIAQEWKCCNPITITKTGSGIISPEQCVNDNDNSNSFIFSPNQSSYIKELNVT